jgi:phage protein D
MLRPAYSVALGGTTLSSETLGPLEGLSVQRAKNAGADWASMVVGLVPDLDVAEGDPVAIELGWDGQTTPVFAGEVEAVDRGLLRLEISAAGSQIKLLRSRSDRTFVNQSAGQVVSALAADVGMETERTEDGIQLPVYLADSGRRAFDHCLALARRCGFDLFTTQAGALVFAPFASSSADRTYRFGADLLAARIERSPAGPGVAVVPESPASASGDETASWLVRDPAPYRAEAGGAVGVVLSDPVLRTKEAAARAAQARIDFRAREIVSGHVEVLGDPAVTLGQSVELTNVPDDALNDLYQVLSVRHILDRGRGYRTFVGLGGMPGGEV